MQGPSGTQSTGSTSGYRGGVSPDSLVTLSLEPAAEDCDDNVKSTSTGSYTIDHI
jgi:hypothetical protein